MFGRRHRLRFVAAQVLLVWLFALAAGIVNACVLEPQARQGVAAAVHDSQDALASKRSHDAHATSGYHQGSPKADKVPCAKFCADPSAGAQGVKQEIDPSGTVWLAPLPVRPLQIEATPRVAGGFAADPGLRRPAIAIAIAFLRLTL